MNWFWEQGKIELFWLKQEVRRQQLGDRILNLENEAYFIFSFLAFRFYFFLNCKQLKNINNIAGFLLGSQSIFEGFFSYNLSLKFLCNL